MIEPPRNTSQVADAVTVRVAEAARVDLIDRVAAPPRESRDRRSRHGRETKAALRQSGHETAFEPGHADSSAPPGDRRLNRYRFAPGAGGGRSPRFWAAPDQLPLAR